jgi:large subunit ribosomal protein L21e
MTTSRGILARASRRLSRHHKPSKLGITDLMKNFSEGDKVVIVQKGNYRNIPHPRYKGKIGKVIEKRGRSYVVEVKVSKTMNKKIICPQMHLEKA